MNARMYAIVAGAVALGACGPSPRPQVPEEASVTRSAAFKARGAGAQAADAPVDASVAWRSELRPRDRAARLDPLRSREVLTTELAQLEASARTADVDDPSRGAFFVRVASTYDELAEVASSEGDTELATRARTKAQETRVLLLNRFPNAPYLDRPLYEVASELERRGHRAEALTHYMSLTRRFPRSPYAPYAWLAIAEDRFERATSPEQWPAVMAAYRVVLEQPAPANKIYGYALYKLAWAQEKSGDHAHALESFHAIEDLAAANPDVPELAQVAEVARAELSSMP